MNFFLATTLRNGPVDLLPHWLDYYLRLGIDQFVLCVYCEGMEGRIPEITAAIEGHPVQVRYYNNWTDAGQEVAMRDALDQIGCRASDWQIHADLDELNEFPAPINELAEKMESAGKFAVHGHFIDRVHAEGKFVALQATPSLAEQYPIECLLTEKILGGCTQKIMLCRHDVIVEPGHHSANVPSGKHVIGTWRDYRVHHFKWRDGVMERLDWTLANVAKRDSSWGLETQRFMDFVKPLGRIPIDDPRIEAMFAGAKSPKVQARTDR